MGAWAHGRMGAWAHRRLGAWSVRRIPRAARASGDLVGRARGSGEGMRIDDGTDPAWGGSGDSGLDQGAEEVGQAADDRTAGSVDDPAGTPKIEWGADEERGGVESDLDGPPNLDPEPAATAPRVTSLDPGDDGGAYSAPGLDEGAGTPTDL
jgi:hypothetical protein